MSPSQSSITASIFATIKIWRQRFSLLPTRPIIIGLASKIIPMENLNVQASQRNESCSYCIGPATSKIFGGGNFAPPDHTRAVYPRPQRPLHIAGFSAFERAFALFPPKGIDGRSRTARNLVRTPCAGAQTCVGRSFGRLPFGDDALPPFRLKAKVRTPPLKFKAKVQCLIFLGLKFEKKQNLGLNADF